MPPPEHDRVAFADLAAAAYCPRQLYYARRADDRAPPADARDRIELAFHYPELRRLDDAALRRKPIALPPARYRAALDRLARSDDWDALTSPAATRAVLTGKDCRGVAHKILVGAGAGADASGGDDAATAESSAAAGSNGASEAARTDGGDGSADAGPPIPVVVSPGEPAERGVWEPQRVRAVAAAKALAWECQRRIPKALVEYPAYGDVRTVRATTRNAAAYRRALRAVRSMDGPPPRLRGDAKCDGCAYRERCGVRTRSLRSLLGF
ncbi:hypothetical protein [Halobaculum sp. P14]|uniref:hypothetical protein n=1 Tax=Halobaculum sp. P14 TaxID=3421638 RepID=UPI003EB8DC15